MEPDTIQLGAATWSRCVLALAFLCPAMLGHDAKEVPGELVWDARAAEHLINRAGFGARPEEIARAVELGAEGFVDALLAGPGTEPARFPAERFDYRAAMRAVAMSAGSDDPQSRRLEFAEADGLRDADQAQRDRYLDFWMERLLAAEDPLRERMTLFWHGYFTSSYRDVKNSYELIAQNEFLRTNALGRFSDLVRGIARDPAMLEYLDNDSNRKGHPNENFARELMELFTLGEGHYGEHDVKEAARAFTGWTDEDGVFTFEWRRHDFGYKTVLGKTGRLDGDDVLDILLAQETCARFVAARLLGYFEGSKPVEERVAEYAALLRASEYDLASFLRHLFLDPRFYRAEIVGARVASPLDYLIGCARRLGLEPPGRFLALASAALGERLFDPPNVKGWEGGEAWITTASLIGRSNQVGALLGVVEARDVLGRGARRVDPDADSDTPQDGDGAREPGSRNSGRLAAGTSRFLDLSGRVGASGLARDEAIVDLLLSELLAVPPSPEIRSEALAFLATARGESPKREGRRLVGREGVEPVLRRLAHFILSLPDAHLN